MPMDILVVRSREREELAEVPGLVYSTILKEGKVVYERAAGSRPTGFSPGMDRA